MEDGERRKRLKSKNKELKKRKQIKSIIAAYVSGKVPLCKIMNPSRLSTKRNPNVKLDLNRLNACERTLALPKTVPNRQKRPTLKDYIDGNVSVSQMIAPQKINEIPSKRKEFEKFMRKQNHGTHESYYRGCENLFRTTIAYDIIDKLEDADRKDDEAKSIESKLFAPGTSTVSKYSSDEPSSNSKIKNTPDTVPSSTLSLSASTIISSKVFNDDPREDKLQHLEKGSFQLRVSPVISNLETKSKISENFGDSTSIESNKAAFDSLAKSFSSKYSSNRCQIHHLSRRHTGSMRLYERQEFLNIIKNHENVEECLIKQIIHLRKERDKYQTLYVGLIKIHKILANRWFQFKRLNID